MFLQVKKYPQQHPNLPVAFHHVIPTPSSQRRQPVETQDFASHEQPIASRHPTTCDNIKHISKPGDASHRNLNQQSSRNNHNGDSQ